MDDELDSDAYEAAEATEMLNDEYHELEERLGRHRDLLARWLIASRNWEGAHGLRGETDMMLGHP